MNAGVEVPVRKGRPPGSKDGQRRRADGVWLDRRTSPPKWKMRYIGLDGLKHIETAKHPESGVLAVDAKQAASFRNLKLREIADAATLGLKSVDRLQPVTFKTFAEDWIQKKEDFKKNAEGSIVHYSSHLKRLIPFFGSMALGAISKDDVDNYIVMRGKSHRVRCKQQDFPLGVRCKCAGIAPVSISDEVNTLRQILYAGVRGNRLKRNVVRDAEKIRYTQDYEPRLEPSQEERLLNCCEDWLRDVCIIGLQTGKRLAEILRIKRGDIDFGRKLLLVPKTKTNKTGHVAIEDPALEVFQRRMVYLGKEGASEFVFTDPSTGKPYTERNVQYYLRKAIKAAGLTPRDEDRRYGISFHAFKHVLISRLREDGVSNPEIRFMTGNSDALINRYAHHTPEYGRRGARAAAARSSLAKDAPSPVELTKGQRVYDEGGKYNENSRPFKTA